MILTAVKAQGTYLMIYFEVRDKRLLKLKKAMEGVFKGIRNSNYFKVFSFDVGTQSLFYHLGKISRSKQELHIYSEERQFLELSVNEKLKSKKQSNI